MGEKISPNNSPVTMAKTRNILNKFFSVQFSLDDRGPVYLFKLRNQSTDKPCIFVKEDSYVIKRLEVGDILFMEYSTPELSRSNKLLKTQIISKNSHDRFSGHFRVGLAIIDEQMARL